MGATLVSGAVPLVPEVVRIRVVPGSRGGRVVAPYDGGVMGIPGLILWVLWLAAMGMTVFA
ncbi:hypothetical protein, partial [Streptomyces sp. NPDC101166]|uniref:hypothetical protein n=1 Tax=Streptomyces sp. NPDC101166 TaxID=3366120 RepID=UPI0038088682